MSYNSAGAQLLRSVTATQRVVWSPELGWDVPTHCAACGIPLTPENILRQHAGGQSCSHGPHD